MLLKITIIMWILVLVFRFVAVLMVRGMSVEEKLVYKFRDEMPLRLLVLNAAWLLSIVAALVLTVITIIKW